MTRRAAAICSRYTAKYKAHKAVRDAYSEVKQVRYDIKIGGFWDDFAHEDRGGFALNVPDSATAHHEIYGGMFPLYVEDVRRMIGACFRETRRQPAMSVECYVERFAPIENLKQLVEALRCMLFRVCAKTTTGRSV